MVFRLLQSLFTPLSSQAGKYDEALIQAAIERVVDGTDPRLRAAGNYQRKLRDGVEHAVEYVITLVDTLPPAVEASRRCFTTDPRLRAFFVSSDHLQETVSFSQGLRDYFREATNPLPQEIYAALGMRRSEKPVLGLELQGEIIRRDVPQVAVNFGDHRLVFVTGSEMDTRRELKKRAFDHLIEIALQRLVSRRARRQELEQQRILLQTKAKALKAGKPGLEALLEPTVQKATDFAALEQRLREIEAELVQVRADSATLENHLARVAATLSKPEEYLRLERISLTLDHMNIKVSEDSPRSANTLTFDEVFLGGARRAVVLFIRFPSNAILPRPDPFEEMGRYL